MIPTTIAAALLIGGVALFLPVTGTAAALVGAESPLLPRVQLGVWIFKLLLLWHAAVLVVSQRWRLTVGRPSEALVAEGQGEGNRWSRIERVTLAALLAIGAALRLHDLGDGLWFDEIRTLVGYVRLPLARIVSTFDSQNQHMLYSIVARGTVVVFGESAWALRLPAALFGIASIGVLYWFATLVTTRREALLAAALLTVSYHHVWFSQNARGYTSLLLLSLLGSGMFLRLFARRGGQGWGLPAAYAMVMALAVYTHVTAVFVVVAHFAIWLWVWWRARPDGRILGGAAWAPLGAFVLAATLSLQLYAVVLPQFVQTITTPTMAGVATEWKSPLWLLAETGRGMSQGLPGGWLTFTVGIVVALGGVVSYARQSAVVMAVMLLPGVITAGAALVLAHNLWPRLFFFAAGFAVLIAIRGLFSLAQALRVPQAPRLAVAASGLLILTSASTVPRAWYPKQDFAGARDYVERLREPGDAVVTVDLSRYPFQTYLAAGWVAVDNPSQLREIEREHRRTWVLYTFPLRLAAVQPEIWGRLQEAYRQAAEFPGTVGGGDVIVMVRE